MGGNLVVCRIGTGAAALSNVATAVFLDEYTPAGALVQSIPMPTATAGAQAALTASGTATSECYLTRSANRAYLVVTGYSAAAGTTNVVGSTVPRVFGRVDHLGNVDTSTTTTAYASQNIRSAVTNDGTSFWAAGSGTGVIYQSFGVTGAGTLISSTLTALRNINIYNGQLYVSSQSGAFRLSSIGTGLPTATGQTITNLPGFPTTGTSPYSYFFADLSPTESGVDTVYVADDSLGLQKYTKVSGSWALNGTVATTIRGITGNVGGASVVTLYGTTTNTSGNALVAYTDTSGYNARPAFAAKSEGDAMIPGAPTTIATAGTNTVFRGVQFAPLSTTVAMAAVSGRVLSAHGRGLSNVSVTISGGALAQPITTVTGSMGYYSFPEMEVGSSYILTVNAKRNTFVEPSRLFTLLESITDADFVAEQ